MRDQKQPRSVLTGQSLFCATCRCLSSPGQHILNVSNQTACWLSAMIFLFGRLNSDTVAFVSPSHVFVFVRRGAMACNWPQKVGRSCAGPKRTWWANPKHTGLSQAWHVFWRVGFRKFCLRMLNFERHLGVFLVRMFVRRTYLQTVRQHNVQPLQERLWNCSLQLVDRLTVAQCNLICVVFIEAFLWCDFVVL